MRPLKDSFKMRFTLNSSFNFTLNECKYLELNYVRKSKSIQIFIEPHRISSSLHIGITDIHDFVNIVTKASKI